MDRPLVIVPYTDLQTRTKASLNSPLLDVHFLLLSNRDNAYWEALKNVWHEGRSFIVVEHDIIASVKALLDLWLCPSPWCSQPYQYRGSGWIRALGCTKFSSEIIEKVPDLFERILELPFPKDPTKKATYWRSLDSFMFKILKGEGFQVCPHDIKVGHFHRYLEVPYKGYIQTFVWKEQ
jgi:hypothetical protein